MNIKDTLVKEWRTVLELRYLNIKYDPTQCIGCWQCQKVCPIGCWTPIPEARVVEFHDIDRCVACGACVLQCPEDAIQLTTDASDS
jgi:formate hydrogenlyase subunit 6/NADH:ubiquinone oxidoreductase subunit I